MCSIKTVFLIERGTYIYIRFNVQSALTKESANVHNQPLADFAPSHIAHFILNIQRSLHSYTVPIVWDFFYNFDMFLFRWRWPARCPWRRKASMICWKSGARFTNDVFKCHRSLVILPSKSGCQLSEQCYEKCPHCERYSIHRLKKCHGSADTSYRSLFFYLSFVLTFCCVIIIPLFLLILFLIKRVGSWLLFFSDHHFSEPKMCFLFMWHRYFWRQVGIGWNH